nr:unnamed protein product [Naegleria fowleri]
MSFFYEGKSPMDDIPTPAMVKHNQAQTSIRRYITHENLQRKRRKKKKDSYLHRNIGTQRWNFIRTDSDQVMVGDRTGNIKEEIQQHSILNSYKEGDEDESCSKSLKKSFRKKKNPKSISQLKQERIQKNELMYKEIESSIRDQLKEEDLDSVVSILRDRRFSNDDTNIQDKQRGVVPTEHHQDENVSDLKRPKQSKFMKDSSIHTANSEKQPTSTIPSLPKLNPSKVPDKKITSAKDKRTSPTDTSFEDESDDPLRDLFSRDADFVTDDMIPSYQTIHPLDLEMKETIDFPSDLLEDFEELYIEDTDYIDYKKRLTSPEGYDSDSDQEKAVTEDLDEKEKFRQKAINFSHMWFLPPSQWSSTFIDEKKKKKDKQFHSDQVLNQQLQDLSSSKLFKSFLMKSNTSVPNWLKNVNDSKNQSSQLLTAHEKSTSVIPAIIKSLHNDSSSVVL